MKISKRSWHYKLINKFNNNMDKYTKDGCTYFRELAHILLGLSFLVAITVVLFMLPGLMFTSVFMEGAAVSTTAIVLLVTSVIFWAIAGAAIYLHGKLDSVNKVRKQSKTERLVREYIKARKEKYCPVITIVE